MTRYGTSHPWRKELKQTLRRCAYANCRREFAVQQSRQRYCSTECASAARAKAKP